MRDFQKKKSQKPTGNGSGNSFDDIESIQREEGSTAALLDEIDMLLDACSKPIESIEKKKEEQQQEQSRKSDSCTCF